MAHTKWGTHGPKLTDTDFLIYAAGFLDGEGCFRIRAGSTPDVRVTQTFPWVLFLLRSAFGGTVHHRFAAQGNWRGQWEWYCSGEEALTVCKATRPHLIEKKKQAELVIAFRSTRPHSAQRRSIVKQLNELKRISYD